MSTGTCSFSTEVVIATSEIIKRKWPVYSGLIIEKTTDPPVYSSCIDLDREGVAGAFCNT